MYCQPKQKSSSELSINFKIDISINCTLLQIMCTVGLWLISKPVLINTINNTPDRCNRNMFLLRTLTDSVVQIHVFVFTFYQPYVDFFTGEKMLHPLSDAPEPKSRHIPSKWEHKRVRQSLTVIVYSVIVLGRYASAV